MHSLPPSIVDGILYCALVGLVFWRAAKQKRRWLRVLLRVVGVLLLGVMAWNAFVMMRL